MKNTLQTIYLRLDKATSSLSNSALAQLILKIIYFSSNPLSKSQIGASLKDILGTTVSDKKLDACLEYLVREEKVNFNNDQYHLGKARRSHITDALTDHNKRIERVIEKFFNKTETRKESIRKWFDNLTIDFFSTYKDEWMASKTYSLNNREKYVGVNELIFTHTKSDKNILNSDVDWLSSQYLEFLNSTDDDVNSIFWDYGTSALSSTLITSSTSADKLSIDALKDSIFILDTNILFDLQLKNHKLYKSFQSLEEIFLSLNIKPYYFDITSTEYLSTMNYKKVEILNVLEKYSADVIEELADPFIIAAKNAGCNKLKDYSAFFDKLLIIPDKFVTKLELDELITDELQVSIFEGTEDEALKEEINEIYRNRSRYFNPFHIKRNCTSQKDKKNAALLHDAGLIAGASYLRNIGNKCFILTKDITVKQYGIEHILRDDPPIAIGLDILIGMLAIENGGIDVDPSNFKPLFANIIKSSLIPDRTTFQVTDLARMIEINTQFAELPSKDIFKIAKDVNQLVFKGTEENKIALEIQRHFQNFKLTNQRDIDQVKAEKEIEINRRKKAEDKFTSTRNILRVSMIQERINSETAKIDKAQNLYFVYFPLGTTILAFLSEFIFIASSGYITFVISFIAGIASGYGVFLFQKRPKLFKGKNFVKDIEKLVDEELSLRGF